jgi:hypothetical protein
MNNFVFFFLKEDPRKASGLKMSEFPLVAMYSYFEIPSKDCSC